MKFNTLVAYILNEGGGEEPGKFEIDRTSLPVARSFASNLFDNLDETLPDFDKNYLFAQKMAKLGQTQRKDMPVINTEDIKEFQRRLKDGYIDLKHPLANITNKNDPFPEGLSGADAEKFLNAGLKQNDGSDSDDPIKVYMDTVSVKDLKPIQKQIYFDKSIEAIAKFGIPGTKDFLQNKSIFIASKDNFIIDGHHRFLSGNLIDPNMKVKVLKIDLPIRELLPLTIAYGDAIGNKRNL